MEISRLSYEFTRVVSPIDGQISRYYLTLGNLVNQDQTLLTTVVSVDPMYVYFEMDEPTLSRYSQGGQRGQDQEARQGHGIPVAMATAGGGWLSAPGNDQLRQQPGQSHHRQYPGARRISQPLAQRGRRLLSPGMFVKIRLPIGEPHPALLVLERAIASDQGLKYVYVVDAENKAQYRRVTTGARQDDGLRVIEQGLKPDDWVVFGGLQQVRPRMTVRPERAPMLSSGQPDETKKASPSVRIRRRSRRPNRRPCR